MSNKTSSSIVGAIRGARNDIGELVVPLLKQKDITIGRSSTNTIVIKSEYVSRQHCRIYAAEASEGSGIWMACVEDLSAGMTWLNGVRIGKHNHKALYPGCTLTIADSSIAFYFIGVGYLKKKWINTTSMKWINGKELIVSNEMVGQGSQSSIYLVGTTFPCRHQLVCRRTKNPKLFEPGLTYHTEKLQNEVSILLKLHHPNVIRLLKYTINTDKTYSMLFPLVCGGTLEKYTTKRPGKPPLHTMQIRFIMNQIFSATKYIHANGIIHRDLKPGNILVYKTRSPYPRIVVTDFGLCINVENEKQWSHSFGTQRYFAPEIAFDDASSDPFDYKVDCWSIGMILYQMFTHVLPYELQHHITTTDDSYSWEQHRAWILDEKLDMKSDPVWSSVPSAAKQLLHHLLEKDPKKRYSSQQAFTSPFVQVDFMKHGLLERQAHIWSSHMELLKWIKDDATSSPASFSSKNAKVVSEGHTKRRRLPPIRIGTNIPVPGNPSQKSNFNKIINRAVLPMHFENGKPIYPPSHPQLL